MKNGCRKIRLGLLVDSLDVQAWMLRCLEQIVASDHTEIALVVMPEPESQIRRKRLGRRIVENRRELGWHMQCRLEKRFFRSEHDAFAVENAADLLDGIPKILVRPRRTKFSDYIESADLAKIAEHEVDVFVRFGFRILRGEILTLAPGGVWSFHHGDNTQYRGGPPGVWEIFQKRPVTGAILQKLDESLDDGIVLDRVFCATDLTSVLRTQNGLFWAAMPMLPRALRRLHKLGRDEFFARAKARSAELNTAESEIYHEPDNLQTLRLFAGQACRLAGRKIKNLISREQWALMYRLADSNSLNVAQTDEHGLPRIDLKEFTLIPPPRGKFQADPFVIERDGIYHVFFEEWDYKARRGHISWMTINQDGECSPAQPIIKQPYHMSYPFVFEHDGELFMIPETYENRTIEVYRCEEFPARWQLCKTLMKDIVAFDATMLHHKDRYWLFASVQENPGAWICNELFLFSADDPLSDNWRSHPMNPIVADVRRARPAGRIFAREGKLYRPGQDCSRDYGYAVGLHEITTLNETEYAEKQVGKIQPDPAGKIKGVHTFNQAGRLTVLDVKFDRLRFF